jgi:ferredoxin
VVTPGLTSSQSLGQHTTCAFGVESGETQQRRVGSRAAAICCQWDNGRMSEPLLVRVDQDECTGDGLCVQLAPEVFEFDVDGLAYVKGPDGELQLAAGATVEVPARCVQAVIDSAADCPGDCIYVVSRSGAHVAGPLPAGAPTTPEPASTGGV